MQITEIYKSLQGESTYAGLPCIFVRLTGCNLRCTWCDSEYTFQGGVKMSLEQVMGCGLGGCYSCVVLAHASTGLGAGGEHGGAPHHTRTCIEGPVFNAQRVVWDAVAAH